jgi:hypothetical protein
MGWNPSYYPLPATSRMHKHSWNMGHSKDMVQERLYRRNTWFHSQHYISDCSTQERPTWKGNRAPDVVPDWATFCWSLASLQPLCQPSSCPSARRTTIPFSQPSGVFNCYQMLCKFELLTTTYYVSKTIWNWHSIRFDCTKLLIYDEHKTNGTTTEIIHNIHTIH